jgi:hypothetical protein
METALSNTQSGRSIQCSGKQLLPNYLQKASKGRDYLRTPQKSPIIFESRFRRNKQLVFVAKYKTDSRRFLDT